MKSLRRHIVIIGGGFAGIATAKELKNADVDISIIDKSNHHLFQPLLYQVATAALSPGDIATPIRAILGKNSRAKVILGEVNDIQPKAKKLKLFDGRTVSFDQLVVAPGAKYNYFGNENWQEFAPSLKSVSDSLKLRENILLSLEEAEQIEDPRLKKSYLTYVIIGGGPTGVELAGAIAEIAKNSMRRNFRNIHEDEVRIILLEAAPTILNAFSKSSSRNATQMLKNLGVKVLCNMPVCKIEKNKVHLQVGSIDSANIIWAAGIKASSLLNSLKVPQDRMGRVFVREDMSIPNYPDIFVLGDAAHFKQINGSALPALASVASQQGKFVGKLLKKNDSQTQDRPAFRYLDKGKMATIGRAKAVAEVKGMKFSGFFAWFLWSGVHIMLLNGLRSKVLVFVEWVWNFFTLKRGVRLITDRSACEHCSLPVLPEKQRA